MQKSIFILLMCISNAVNARQLQSPQQNDSTGIPHIAYTVQNSEGSFRSCNKIRALIVPASFIAYGFIALNNADLKRLNVSTKTEIREHHPSFVSGVDNFLQYAPVMAVYGLNMAGVKGKHNFQDRTTVFLMSTVISAAIVQPLKHITKVERPDGSALTSFPSGHTATAFAGAELLRQEYKDVSPWYSVAGYAAATTTGMFRLYNNKHWVSDVVEGAGIGILSTRLAYWLYPAVKKKLFKSKPMDAMLMPYYQDKTGGIAMLYNFSNR